MGGGSGRSLEIRGAAAGGRCPRRGARCRQRRRPAAAADRRARRLGDADRPRREGGPLGAASAALAPPSPDRGRGERCHRRRGRSDRPRGRPWQAAGGRDLAGIATSGRPLRPGDRRPPLQPAPLPGARRPRRGGGAPRGGPAAPRTVPDSRDRRPSPRLGPGGRPRPRPARLVGGTRAAGRARPHPAPRRRRPRGRARRRRPRARPDGERPAGGPALPRHRPERDRALALALLGRRRLPRLRDPRGARQRRRDSSGGCGGSMASSQPAEKCERRRVRDAASTASRPAPSPRGRGRPGRSDGRRAGRARGLRRTARSGSRRTRPRPARSYG